MPTPLLPTPSLAERQLANVLELVHSGHMRRTGTAAHAARVAALARATARELGLGDAHAERLHLASLVHDVGKAWIPERVLMKPGALDPDEWRMIERHPAAGARMLGAAPLADLAEWVLCHHERPDGRGYPHARTAATIPLEAAILSACDAFDAMTSQRPASRPLTHGAALAELAALAGRQFDPRVVSAVEEVVTGPWRLPARGRCGRGSVDRPRRYPRRAIPTSTGEAAGAAPTAG